MGRPTFRTLDDIAYRGGNLWVECPKCGRHVIYPIRQVIDYFCAKRWNTAMEGAGSHFRCEGTRLEPGCGHKGAFLGIVPQKEKPAPALPAPIESGRGRR